MILVTGGIYQHKLDFIYEKFGLTKDDVSFVENNIDYNKNIIYKLNDLIRYWINENKDIDSELEILIKNCKEKIIVMDNVGSGIIPIDKNIRDLREIIGRAGCKIAENSDEVYSVLCGIGIKIKG